MLEMVGLLLPFLEGAVCVWTVRCLLVLILELLLQQKGLNWSMGL